MSWIFWWSCCLIYCVMSLSLSYRSFFELMLFFSKEEFVEKPLKDILDSFQVTKTDPLFFQSLVFMFTQHSFIRPRCFIYSYLSKCWVRVKSLQDSQSPMFYYVHLFHKQLWTNVYYISHIAMLFPGMPLSAPAAQERLPSACEADHQSRRPMGESSPAGNPKGGRLASKGRYAHDHT